MKVKIRKKEVLGPSLYFQRLFLVYLVLLAVGKEAVQAEKNIRKQAIPVFLHLDKYSQMLLSATDYTYFLLFSVLKNIHCFLMYFNSLNINVNNIQ